MIRNSAITDTPRYRHPLSACICLLCLAIPASAIHIGQTYDELISELGSPKGTMAMGSTMALTYDGGVIELKNGRVTYFPENFTEQKQERIEQKEFEETQRAKGLVEYNGEWVTPRQAGNLQRRDKAEADKKRKEILSKRRRKPIGFKDGIKEIRKDGATVDLNDLIVDKEVTIIDFFADWCGPCRKLSPQLETMARQHPNVYLVKIDIKEWGSPVVKQHDIHLVPHVRVYNKEGKQVGKFTSNLHLIAKYVNQALQQE